MAKTGQRIDAGSLEKFTVDVLTALGVRQRDAELSAEILVTSDVRGIDSHGVPRLTGVCNRIRHGVINLEPEYRVVAETPATLALDADNGLGHPASHYAMSRCIEKAKETGLCMTTVRNSNHFGIAGYYSMMALEAGLCGVAMTNATPLVVPTFAREGYLSTAPISAAIPTGKEQPIIIDFATSTVAWGKIEMARRDGKPIPAGWALDAEGKVTTDAEEAVALTPLGATRDLGGHKGYGLALLVEVLCGQLAGANWARYVSGSKDTDPKPSNLGHAFMAWRIDAFRPKEEFLADVDSMIAELRSAETIDGHEQVLIPGEPEAMAEADRRANGIPLHPRVIDDLHKLGDEVGVPFPISA